MALHYPPIGRRRMAWCDAVSIVSLPCAARRLLRDRPRRGLGPAMVTCERVDVYGSVRGRGSNWFVHVHLFMIPSSCAVPAHRRVYGRHNCSRQPATDVVTEVSRRRCDVFRRSKWSSLIRQLQIVAQFVDSQRQPRSETKFWSDVNCLVSAYLLNYRHVASSRHRRTIARTVVGAACDY